MGDVGRRVSVSGECSGAEPGFEAVLVREDEQLGGVADLARHEPYRSKCRIIAARLARTLDYVSGHELRWTDEPARPPGVYLYRRELLADLNEMAADLRQAGAEKAAAGKLHDFMRLLHRFGLPMPTL